MDIGIAIFKNKLSPQFKHGKSGYSNHRCRCAICIDENKAYRDTPERKEAQRLSQRKCDKTRYLTPERKEYLKALRQTPKVKSYTLAYRSKYKNTLHGKEVQFNCQLRSKFGITSSQYREMLEKQKGVCAICGGINSNGRKLAVDHSHDTGKIRNLLCSTCNHGLGHFKDNQTLLLNAVEYVRK